MASLPRRGKRRGGRKGYAETHLFTVFLAQKIRAETSGRGRHRSLREIADLLANAGLGIKRGQATNRVNKPIPYGPSAIQTMLHTTPIKTDRVPWFEALWKQHRVGILNGERTGTTTEPLGFDAWYELSKKNI